MTDVPAAVAEAADHVAVTRLQQAYADAVTRRDWAALDDLFLPDAVVALDLVTRPPREIVGPAALGVFIAGAIERFDFFQFVVLTSHVTLWPDGDHDAATARVFMCELRRERGEQERGEAFGLYRDRYARVDGRWWFAARAYRSMARWPGGEVFPLPPE
jgi:hypothetical protein